MKLSSLLGYIRLQQMTSEDVEEKKEKERNKEECFVGGSVEMIKRKREYEGMRR